MKENQPELLAAIADAFDDRDTSVREQRLAAAERQRATASNKGHGRRETRTLLSTTALNHGYLDWPHLGQCFQLVRQRTIKGKTTSETVYGITSLTRSKADARRLLKLVRNHWSIESMFWVRDVTFGEDGCQAATGAAPLVLSALRNVAVTLIDHAAADGKPVNIARALRRHAAHPQEALALVQAGSG